MARGLKLYFSEEEILSVIYFINDSIIDCKVYLSKLISESIDKCVQENYHICQMVDHDSQTFLVQH